MLDTLDFREVIRMNLSQGQKRGANARLAAAIGIHTTTLSQVLNGSKPLSLEHAALICDYFAFSDSETEYFLLLVQLARAGNTALEKKIRNQIDKIRREARNLAKSLRSQSELGFEDQAIFYSDWRYSAIRILCSIDEYRSIDAIAEKLSLTRPEVKVRADFLVRVGLCSYDKGLLKPGPSYTHLPSDSPLISKLHGNIRVKSMDHHARLQDSDLVYSAFMAVSTDDVEKIRSVLKSAVERVNRIRENSGSESMQLLAIDWIKI